MAANGEISSLYESMVAEGLVASEPTGALSGVPIVSLDEATAYFYELSGRPDWMLGDEIPPVTPPFHTCFLQTRAPRTVRDDKGEEIPVEFPLAWGALVRAEDLRKSHGDRDGWREAAHESALSVLGVYGFEDFSLGKALTEGSAEYIRWLVELSFYSAERGEQGQAVVRGPFCYAYLGVREDGMLARIPQSETPAEHEEGDRFRVFVVENTLRERLGDEWARGVLRTSASLSNPLLFGMSLMHCKNASVVEAGTRPTKDEAEGGEVYEGLEPASPPSSGAHHYELRVEPMSRALRLADEYEEADGQDDGSEDERRAVPLSVVRGHFKHYSEERPLFGRYSGQYWFCPHLRGLREAGEIGKDYSVKRPAEKPAWMQVEEDVGKQGAEDGASTEGASADKGVAEANGQSTGPIRRWWGRIRDMSRRR